MFAYRDPLEVNEEFIANHVYVKKCLIDDNAMAKALKLKFDGKTTQRPEHICVAETSHYQTSGVPQHFFIFAPKGTFSDLGDFMLDPLDKPNDMAWKPVKYKIKSYRLFHEKKLIDTVKPEFYDSFKYWLDKGVFTKYTDPKRQPTWEEIGEVLKRIKDMPPEEL
jgi:hypothetical protein